MPATVAGVMPGTWSWPMMCARSSVTEYLFARYFTSVAELWYIDSVYQRGALCREALVLDADRVHVDVPVAGLEADVLGVEVLGDVAVVERIV